MEDDECKQYLKFAFTNINIDKYIPLAVAAKHYDSALIFLQLLLDNNVYYPRMLCSVLQNIGFVGSEYRHTICKTKRSVIATSLMEIVDCLDAWISYVEENSETVNLEEIVETIKKKYTLILSFGEEMSTFWAINDLMYIIAKFPHSKTNISVLNHIFQFINKKDDEKFWDNFRWDDLTQCMVSRWSHEIIGQIITEAKVIEFLSAYLQYTKEHWIRRNRPNTRSCWSIMEILAGHNLHTMIQVYQILFDEYWLFHVRDMAVDFKKIIKNMIQVQSGILLRCTAGDANFTWEHQRLFFIAFETNKVNGGQCFISFLPKDVLKYLMSFLDIRYDGQIYNSHIKDIKQYRNCMELIYNHIHEYDLKVDTESKANLRMIKNTTKRNPDLEKVANIY